MTRYAIPITEDFLDLIEILNEGGRPAIEERKTYYIFETFGRTDLHQTIHFEDDLYDETGTSRIEMVWIVG